MNKIIELEQHEINNIFGSQKPFSLRDEKQTDTFSEHAPSVLNIASFVVKKLTRLLLYSAALYIANNYRHLVI